MSKNDVIVHFPKAKRPTPNRRIPDITQHSIYHGSRRVEFLPWNLVLNVLLFLMGCVQTIIQTLLFFFRPFLFLVCQYTVFFGMIGFIVCLVTHPHNPKVTYLFGGCTFAGFLVMHLYDGLILLVSRGTMIKVFNGGR